MAGVDAEGCGHMGFPRAGTTDQDHILSGIQEFAAMELADQSFSHFIDLLREAAIDPKVREIGITIYRVSETSKVVNALLNAELAKISEKLPLFELPVSQKVKFGSASTTRRETIPTGRGSTLDLDITIPETTREREIAIVRYAFLETGLHILGSIK